MSSYTLDLETGTAALLAANGIGTYRPTGVYQASDPLPILFGAWPDGVGEAIKITAYWQDDTTSDRTSTMFQVATRVHGYAAALSVVDQIRDLLHRRAHFDLGQARISLCMRRSFADLGLDTETGLYEHSQNFELRGARSILPTLSR